MIIDANVLLYARDAASPLHDVARSWLEGALGGDQRLGVPWPTVLAYVRLTTHPRVVTDPLSPVQAWSEMSALLEHELVWIPAPTARHAAVLGQLIVTRHATGNLVPDAHLAALAIEHGVAVVSADSDFARFPEVRWVNPVA